jgi:hypothetical protein
MSENIASLHKERTSLRTFVAALVVLLAGIALLGITNGWGWLTTNHRTISAVLRDVGALMVASVAVTLIWELSSKRAFVAELMSQGRTSVQDLIERTILTQQLQGAGLIGFTTDFSYGIDWLGMFRGAGRVDLFFSYARSWLNNNAAQLQELARRDGCRVRVVLPDPNNPQLMAELARRFEKTADEIVANINATSNDLVRIFVEPFEEREVPRRPDFSLFYANTAPQFTFYRFDGKCILVLYKHRSGRGGVPVFTAEQGGTIHEFVLQEMDAFVDDEQLADRIYPPRNEQ